MFWLLISLICIICLEVYRMGRKKFVVLSKQLPGELPSYPIIGHAYLFAGDDEESGITVPKGTGLMFNIWAIHRNARYWGEDAELFRPERYLDPLPNAAQFMPFSYGLRNCLGFRYAMMSIKTALATILRQYKILPPADADEESLKKPLRVKYDIMMKAVDKFQIQLENRALQTSKQIGLILS